MHAQADAVGPREETNLRQLVRVLLPVRARELRVRGKWNQALADPEEPNAVAGIPRDDRAECLKVCLHEAAHLARVRQSRKAQRAIRRRRQCQVLGGIANADHARPRSVRASQYGWALEHGSAPSD